MGCRVTQNSNYTAAANKGTVLVCKLHKSLYGLKQSPRMWFAKFSTFLLSIGYTQSKADYSLFFLHKADTLTLILVYVDDLLLCGNSMSAISALKSQLSQTFNMKDLGELRYFLGIEVDRNEDGIFLSQMKYTADIIHEFGMSNCKPLQLPLDTHLKLTPEKGDVLPDPSIYQKLIGRLI